jgi:ferrous iron transport protein B
MRIALAGQPNCGKSTLFNHIAGYKAITSNFPGTTVKYTETQTHINGHTCTCIDLPGTYSLAAGDMAEMEARRHLLSGEVDLIVNVVDASLLGRSLELTLQLLELEIPMVLCLNMMDEAHRKGIQIDVQKLSSLLGIPVVPAVASMGKGLKELFQEVLKVWQEKSRGKTQKFSKDIEEVIWPLACLLETQWPVQEKLPPRFLAIKLLENDPFFLRKIQPAQSLLPRLKPFQERLEEHHGVPPEEVISSERHALAMNLLERASRVIHSPKRDLRTLIDQWVMHKIFGYGILVLVLYGFFNFIFGVGGYIEEPLLRIFTHLSDRLKDIFEAGSLLLFLSRGTLQGIAGGIAIVLPYLVPFLLGLSLLEDLGYLPRVAFLMDVFMHRMGLHGKSIIPFILGYGCSVPAVMATRILEFPQHRFIVSVLATMIPCAARITIIFALVAFLIGPNAALAIFALNILVVAVLGKILSGFFRGAGLGLILEIPAYQVPPLGNTLRKSWYRIREFIVIAWPILIAGSALLALMEYAGVERYVNWFLSPLTWLLGLPDSVGTTLIFGILRKELSLIMLTQALGTTEILTVMTETQVMVFAVFVTFYIPCLATIAVLWREIGRKGTLLAILLSLSAAVILSLITRMVGELFLS